MPNTIRISPARESASPVPPSLTPDCSTYSPTVVMTRPNATASPVTLVSAAFDANARIDSTGLDGSALSISRDPG